MCGQGLCVFVTPRGFHVVAHGTAGTEATCTAGTETALGSVDGLAVCVTGALGGEALLTNDRGGCCCDGRGQRGAADPELHHGQQHCDRTGENETEAHRGCWDEALDDVGEHEQLPERVEGEYNHDGGDGQVVVAKVVGPGGNLHDAIQSVHF